jgi:hypothetical protein
MFNKNTVAHLAKTFYQNWIALGVALIALGFVRRSWTRGEKVNRTG